MRLAGQVRGGFYAAAPEAVAAVLERLRPPALGECLVLDPCAGQGMALLQLCQGLGDATGYGIELSEDRAAIVAALLDEDKTLCPADFLRTTISYGSFGLVWCNPPYDFSTGTEGRVESQFIHKAAGLLTDGGVLCLVAPYDVADSHETAEFFEERFEQVSAMPFPESVRKYSETVVVGRKRRSPQPVHYGQCPYDWLDQHMERKIIYTLPAGNRPRAWKKTEPTDAELSRLVEQSPLRFALAGGERSVQKSVARPPMSIGAGHRALLLASGFCNGAIAPADEPPHLVRGSVYKESFVSLCESTEDDNGNLSTKTVISERPKLCLRVLESDGTLTTLD